MDLNKFNIKRKFNRENILFLIKYVLAGLLMYGFIFFGLMILVDVLNVNESLSFVIIYALNYPISYAINVKYIFKTKHNKARLVRYIGFIIFFYIVANIFYNICLKLNINYLVATFLAVFGLYPFKLIISKFVVFK